MVRLFVSRKNKSLTLSLKSEPTLPESRVTFAHNPCTHVLQEISDCSLYGMFATNLLQYNHSYNPNMYCVKFSGVDFSMSIWPQTIHWIPQRSCWITRLLFCSYCPTILWDQSTSSKRYVGSTMRPTLLCHRNTKRYSGPTYNANRQSHPWLRTFNTESGLSFAICLRTLLQWFRLVRQGWRWYLYLYGESEGIFTSTDNFWTSLVRMDFEGVHYLFVFRHLGRGPSKRLFRQTSGTRWPFFIVFKDSSNTRRILTESWILKLKILEHTTFFLDVKQWWNVVFVGIWLSSGWCQLCIESRSTQTLSSKSSEPQHNVS